VTGYSGDAGDAMAGADQPQWTSNGKVFSAKNIDNDDSADHCAETNSGGWWYGDCSASQLNKMGDSFWSIGPAPIIPDVQASRMLIRIHY